MSRGLTACSVQRSAGVDPLLPQTHQLLEKLAAYVARGAEAEGVVRGEVRFTQRVLRELLGWSDRALRRQLVRLVELEYVLVYRTGRGTSACTNSSMRANPRAARRGCWAWLIRSDWKMRGSEQAASHEEASSQQEAGSQQAPSPEEAPSQGKASSTASLALSASESRSASPPKGTEPAVCPCEPAGPGKTPQSHAAANTSTANWRLEPKTINRQGAIASDGKVYHARRTPHTFSGSSPIACRWRCGTAGDAIDAPRKDGLQHRQHRQQWRSA